MLEIMDSFLKTLVLVLLSHQASTTVVGNCRDLKVYSRGSVYEKAVHHWPLPSSSLLGDAVTCQDAIYVNGSPQTMVLNDGLYGIALLATTGIKLATTSQDHGCLKSFTNCPEGFSVTFWIRLIASVKTHASGFDVVIATSDSQEPTSGFWIIDDYSQGLQVSVRTNSYAQTKNINIGRNVWSHVAITWTSHDNITCYVNGEKNTMNDTGTFDDTVRKTDQTDGLYLSYSNVAGSSSAGFRDLAVWNYRLTERDIIDIYNHTPGCQEIESNNWNMTSSGFTDQYSADNGRFDSKTAWCNDPSITSGFLQIDLLHIYQLNGLVLKSKDTGKMEFVNTFKLKFSADAVDWQDYKVSGQIKTFTGLASAGSIKISLANPTILTRYLRIYPITSSGRPCLRVRLCGYKQDVLNISAAVSANGTCSVKVNGDEYCPDKDGHNIMTFNYKSGQFIAAKNFETHLSEVAGDLLDQFLSSLENSTVIIAVVKNSGHRISATGAKALYKVGAKSLNATPANVSWILIGHKGSLQKWISENRASSTRESLSLKKIFFLDKEIQPSHFWPFQKFNYYVARNTNLRYYKYLRDVYGGMDLLVVHSSVISPVGGVLAIKTVHHVVATISKPQACIIRPDNCLGGVTASVWLKLEDSSLLKGNEKQPWEIDDFHKFDIQISATSSSGSIKIENVGYSANKGHHVILLDYETGALLGRQIFDLPNDLTAEDRFLNFIKSAPNNTAVLMCSMYQSNIQSPELISVLKSVGARDSRHSSSNHVYILVGYKGRDKMPWIRDVMYPSSSSGSLRTKMPLLGAWTSLVGIQSGEIRDWQFTGTSDAPRLYDVGPGWLINPVPDQNNFLEVRLPGPVVINGIITQGSGTEAAWIKSYKISHSLGSLWLPIKDGSIIMECVGNSDQHTPVSHKFRQPVNTRKFRILPITYHSKIGLRLELLKLNNGYRWLYNQPKLYEQKIPDGSDALIFQGQTSSASDVKFSSSSIRSDRHKPENAALHNYKTTISNGCWCPMTDQNQYLAIFLPERSMVTDISIQGCPSSNEWVTQFTISYKDVDGVLKQYMDVDANNSTMVFNGSNDRHSVSTAHFRRVVYATYLEIHPTTWQGHACLRFELFGHRLETVCFGPLLTTINVQKHVLSSHISPYGKPKAILDTPSGAWCVKPDTPVYMHVDFERMSMVRGIATQGLDGGAWTETFYLETSNNSISWLNHTRDGELLVFKANFDGSSVKVNILDPYIKTRHLRLYPMKGNSPSMTCLRVQFFGCRAENPFYEMSGPLEIQVANGSTIDITGNYYLCRHAIPCPRCKRQLYMDIFGKVHCLESKLNDDCNFKKFTKELVVPSLPGVYNIRVFDAVGDNCKYNMKRTVPGKTIGRVIVKAYNSKSCLDVLLDGHRMNGVYHIRPRLDSSIMTVYCDQMRQGGGWTVIQKRINGTIDFYRTWNEYKLGFGALEGEFWLGNENIHLLTSSSPMELLIEMETFGGKYFYAQYSTLNVRNEAAKYTLDISGYAGTAGDSLTTLHNGAPFSTKDQNNDVTGHNCPELFNSAWWFKQCKDSDLNGKYVAQESGTTYRGIKWEALLGMNKNLKSVEMKIRPKQGGKGSKVKCYPGLCFYVNTEGNHNIYEARKGCWSMGGELATIRNSASANEVANMLLSSATIGLNDMTTEGTFQGFDGTESTYDNWHYKRSHLDCVRLTPDGKFSSSDCNYRYNGYVCERASMCYKSACYRPRTAVNTQGTAKNKCKQLGARLPKIPGSEKSEFIKKYVMSSSSAWIGIVDDNNRFVWEDGSSVTSSNWATSPPSRLANQENCVIMLDNGKWSIVACTSTAGIICQKQIGQSCKELLELGETESGVYEIYSSTFHEGYDPIKVYCDQEKDGGGWELIMRRKDGSIKFQDKLYDDYINGFGNLEGEFWLGLRYFYRLRTAREIMLRLNDTDGYSKYITYGYGYLGGAPTYRLTIHRFTEGSLNSVLGRYNSMPFSTTDKDNDNHPNISCADIYGPGWHWSYYRNKVIDCYDPEVNLFGEYSPQNKGNSKANLFYASFDRPIKYIEMKIRYNYGHQRMLFGTFYPSYHIVYKGISLGHAPHELKVFVGTNTKLWPLSLSPSSVWTHYTISWSENNGVRVYENGILSLQSKHSVYVIPITRDSIMLNPSEPYTHDTFYTLITRLKVWDTDMTPDSVKQDYLNDHCTVDGVVTWEQVLPSSFNWTIGTNSTPSIATGPSSDHTYGMPQGSYYYVETSYPRTKGQSTSIISPTFFPEHHKCLQFWYNMNGTGMGKLSFSITKYTKVPYSFNDPFPTQTAMVWSQEGNQGQNWRFAQIRVPQSSMFTIKVTGVVGSTYQSDMAIDDLTVTVTECPALLSTCKCEKGFTCVQGICDCKGLKFVDSNCKYALNQTVFKDTAHHWPLDDPNNVVNIQSNKNGFTTGKVSAVPGPVNSALATDGDTGQITLADLKDSCILTSPSCSSGFTLRFWLKFAPNNGKEKRVFLSVGRDQQTSRGIQFLHDFSVIDNPDHLLVRTIIEDTSCTMGFEVHPTIWSTVTLTWAKTRGFTIFHNGKNVTTYLIHKCDSVASFPSAITELKTGFGSVLPELSLDDVTLWYKEIQDSNVQTIFRHFTAPQNKITLTLKLPNEIFAERFKDRESIEFKDFHNKLLQNAQAMFNGHGSRFEDTYINDLRNGCILANVSLLFVAITKTDLHLLEESLCQRRRFGALKAYLVDGIIHISTKFQDENQQYRVCTEKAKRTWKSGHKQHLERWKGTEMTAKYRKTENTAKTFGLPHEKFEKLMIVFVAGCTIIFFTFLQDMKGAHSREFGEIVSVYHPCMYASSDVCKEKNASGKPSSNGRKHLSNELDS